MSAQSHQPLLVHNARLFGVPPSFAAADAVHLSNGKVSALSDSATLQAQLAGQAKFVDAGGRLVTIGLIDCHTHLVFAGNRSEEFSMRLRGAAYEEIARSGGGIMSTVRATRVASEDDLLEQSLARLDALIAEGVMHVEVKSGYGLTLESERKMLRVARRLAQLRPIKATTSFLGAHALPPEFANKDAYIDHLIADALPDLAKDGLIDAIDGFCEGIAFSRAQIERLFMAARDLGLPVKLHAEQLSNSGGAALAAQFGALSADHLEWLDQAGIDAMAQSGTVAVLLPGAFYCLKETQKPPVEALRAAGVPLAVATDLNPGTSPIASPSTVMHMACVLFGLTAEEALDGMTRNAGRALGGSGPSQIEGGAEANLIIWNARTPSELVLQLGGNKVHTRIWQGVPH